MDGIEINPSDYYYGMNDIKTSIEEIEEINLLLSSLESLEYDVSLYKMSINSINERLNELYDRLLNVKNALLLLDPSIGSVFGYLDNNSNNFAIDRRNDLNLSNKLDNVKGNNEGIGGLISGNANSVIKNPDTLLNRIKGNNKGLGGHLTTDASSILLGGN